MTDNSSVTGDIVSLDEKGVVLKLPDGSYAERLPWSKFSQADLKDLQLNPKAAEFVEPFIEQNPDERIKRTEIQIKDVPRLTRPANHSLIGALFTSGMGLFILLILYAGNLYAAYEISIFRARPAGVVCGVSAVAPIVGPIIFLSMPTQLRQKTHEVQATAEQQLEPTIAAAIAAEQGVTVEQLAASEAAPAPVSSAPLPPSLPPTKTFQRGQFTFNRRFFETQLSAFMAMSRPEAEKDKILTVKSARGTYVVQRFSKISANDIGLQIQKGMASEEVIIPFVEIQEVQVKHKDA